MDNKERTKRGSQIMINRILMELYDDSEQNGPDKLIEFAKVTLPQDGTDRLFIGCTLILFKSASGFKPRYEVTRENLCSIVLAAKEKIGPTNLLAYYVERINTRKGISKYLKDLVEDPNLDKYADLILEYLDQFRPSFIEDLKYDSQKLEEYIKTKDETREFHKCRKAFTILNDKLDFLPEGSAMSHYEYCQTKGLNKNNFNRITRGYYLNNNVVFYKDNFIFDENVISEALNHLDEISSKVLSSEFEIYFGKIPEENFALDFHYGKYYNGTILKRNEE